MKPPLRHLARLSIGIALLFLPMACGGGNGGGGTRATTRLEQLFPLLESYHVIAFRHDDWCQAIEYKRGRYASSSGTACVSILSGSRRPFDQAARRDHATILAAVRNVHDGVRLLKGLQYNTEGRLQFGIFDCGSGDGDLVYVYSKEAPDLAQLIGGHSMESIGASWYRSR